MKKCFWAKAVAAGALALSASGAWSQTGEKLGSDHGELVVVNW